MSDKETLTINTPKLTPELIETITTRPWPGKCATTGLTMAEFAERLTFNPNNKFDARVSRAAVSICRAYGINGLCDPAYIANVISNALANNDGNG